MVRVLITITFLLAGIRPAAAQQQKAMIQQIAALEIYKAYVKEGYKILDGGLKLIGSIKDGDFSLHKAFFGALKTVNPRFRRYPGIAQALAMQVTIVQRCNQTLKAVRQSGMLKAEEQELIRKVLERLLADCALLLDELTLLITDGQLELKDDERMTRIEGICAGMERKYNFLHGFSNSAIKLAVGRSREQQEVNRVQGYYGIGE